MHTLPIIVFSHLRWDFVYQRPQHLLARLAKHRRMIFIEEPIHAEGESRWDMNTPEPNVHRLPPAHESTLPRLHA